MLMSGKYRLLSQFMKAPLYNTLNPLKNYRKSSNGIYWLYHKKKKGKKKSGGGGGEVGGYVVNNRVAYVKPPVFT